MNNSKYFTWFACAFVACLLITNVVSQKLIPIGPFVFTAGIFLFPITYIFGDVLTEVYGYKSTKKVIWAGFIASLFMAAFLYGTILLPSAPGWELQGAYEQILGQVPRLVVASLIAYLIGEFSNSYVMSKMKVSDEGKGIAKRVIASTLVGQGLDTIVFAFIAFYGVLPTSIIITSIWSGYLFKVVYEVIISPLTVKIVKTIKKKEGIDVFDHNVNYNPLA